MPPARYANTPIIQTSNSFPHKYRRAEQRANRNNLSYDEQYKMDSELESKYCPTDLKKPCNLDFDNPPQSSQ